MNVPNLDQRADIGQEAGLWKGPTDVGADFKSTIYEMGGHRWQRWQCNIVFLHPWLQGAPARVVEAESFMIFLSLMT